MESINPIGLNGVEFVEFSGDINFYDLLFTRYGFESIASNKEKNLFLYRQGDINFIVNANPKGYAWNFFKLHGPCVSGMGFRVFDSQKAILETQKRGARVYSENLETFNLNKIYGIGEALIYLIDSQDAKKMYSEMFTEGNTQKQVEGVGFTIVDHFTNNVPRGEMNKWCEFYQTIFGFKETRYFHIQGKVTGLESRVMKSPCGLFSIPINEPTESKSQIQEYLDEYKGSGVQHLALLCSDIVNVLKKLKQRDLQFLSAPPDTYYKLLKQRLPNCDEDILPLKENGILVDGDEEGYLLQIFSKNIIGPIFFEIIQRKNHGGFGEGNFQALFDSIEQDQRERGYL